MTCKDCSRFKSGRCAMSDEDNDVCSNFSEKAPTKENYETLIKVLTDSMKKQDKLLADIKSGIADLRNKMDSKNMEYYTGYMCALSTVEGLIAFLEITQAKGE